MSEDLKELQSAYQLHQQGRLVEAAGIYEHLIRRNPKNYDALHLLGTIRASFGKYSEAKTLLERSLASEKNKIAYVENYATILFLSHDYERAVQICKETINKNGRTETLQYVLAISLYKQRRFNEAINEFSSLLSAYPRHLAGNNEKASALAELGRYDEALSYIENALKINPNYAEALLNKGNVLGKLKRFDDSMLAFKQAVKLNPNMPDLQLGIGNIFRELKRYDGAFAAYDKALALKADLAEAWLGRGNVFTDLKRHDEAIAAYEKALALKPDLAEAWVGRGNVFTHLKRYDEACAAYDKALALKSDLEGAWLGRGNVFFDLKRYDEAFAAYDKALALKPDLAEAWLGRGNVFSHLKRYDEAFVAYDKAFAIKPDLVGVEGARLRSKMDSCNWDNFASDCNHLIGSVKSNKTNTLPFVLLEINSSVEDQFNCAELWVQKNYPPAIKPFWAGELYKHDKIRIGYVSADFRQHPVAYLMAGVFECHNKSRFDVVAISIGPKDNSELRQRLERSFDKFIDASALSVDEIATKIKNAEIDILIDLNGFTQNARTEVFARRPAPIQVNYLGYLGTMGAEYIDYIVADRTVIPETQKHLYMEKIIYLPNSFQPTDRQRHISDKIFMRADCGLPQEGFVFCNFNAHYKITPDVFDIWMRILMRVNGSVLWLVAGNPTTESNLKKEALVRGVNAERLIFAPPVPLPEHQARLRLADLFLDTLPYNAGATASDTLWAGIPLLTCIGDTFVGRMAASVLEAISLPELITTTPEAYERMAVDLATHPEKLAAIRHKLAENRLTTPLFNTRLFTKHIEAAYIAMHERHQAGLAPDHIVIPNRAH